MSNIFEDGKRLMTEDRFVEAVERFTAALVERPDDAEVLRHRAMAYFCDAEFDKALEDIDRAVSVAPDEAENYGERMFLHGSMDEAADLSADLEAALRLEPDNPKLLAVLARYRIIHADIAGGMEAADRAVELAPDYHTALYFQSICRSWNNRLDESTDGFKKVVELLDRHEDPLPYRMLSFLASSLLCLGEAERCRAVLDEAVRRFPKLPLFYLWRSVLDLTFDNYDEAKTDLDRVAAIYERYPLWDGSFFLGRAAILLREGRDDLAREQIEIVLKRLPDHWEALEMKLGLVQIADAKLKRRELQPLLDMANRLCSLYPKCYRFYLLRHAFHERIGNRSAADTDLDVVLCLLANQPAGLYHAACGLIDSDRTNVALELFDRVLRADPGNVDALRERGQIWCRLGNFIMALADFNRAAALAEPDVELLEWRSIALAESGAYEFFQTSYRKAIDDLTRAIELTPDNFELWGRRATVWCRMALKRWFGLKPLWRNALADYDEALRLNPESASTLFGRGAVHLGLKNYEAAIADCDQAVRLVPDFVEAIDLRAKCRRKLGDEAGAEDDEFALARIASRERRREIDSSDR